MAAQEPEIPLANERVMEAPAERECVMRGLLALTQLPNGPQQAMMMSSPAAFFMVEVKGPSLPIQMAPLLATAFEPI